MNNRFRSPVQICENCKALEEKAIASRTSTHFHQMDTSSTRLLGTKQRANINKAAVRGLEKHAVGGSVGVGKLNAPNTLT